MNSAHSWNDSSKLESEESATLMRLYVNFELSSKKLLTPSEMFKIPRTFRFSCKELDQIEFVRDTE